MYAKLLDKRGRLRFMGLQAPDYISDGKGLLLLSLFGASQAIRACWANIVKHRKGRYKFSTELILIDGPTSYKVGVTPGLKYHMTPLAGGLLIVRQDFDRLHYQWIMGGDEEAPSPWFGKALPKAVPGLAYDDAWLPDLWRAGVEGDLIQAPEDVYGDQESALHVWRVAAHLRNWQKLIKGLLEEGVIA